MGTTSKLALQKKTRFINGQIYIALRNNKLSYFPGDTLEGSILLQQQSNFKSHELKLVFYGKEKTQFSHPSKHKILREYPGMAHAPCKGSNQFIRVEVQITQFKDNISVEGQREYPFKVLLPEWLPSSFIL